MPWVKGMPTWSHLSRECIFSSFLSRSGTRIPGLTNPTTTLATAWVCTPGAYSMAQTMCPGPEFGHVGWDFQMRVHQAPEMGDEAGKGNRGGWPNDILFLCSTGI